MRVVFLQKILTNIPLSFHKKALRIYRTHSQKSPAHEHAGCGWQRLQVVFPQKNPTHTPLTFRKRALQIQLTLAAKDLYTHTALFAQRIAFIPARDGSICGKSPENALLSFLQ